MFKVNTIVLALDGSDGAKRAIPFAVGLAQESKAGIVIAHIDERMGTRGQAPIDIEEERIQAEIQTLVKELAAEGIEARIEIGEMASRGAEIAHAIADIAEKSKADLIVTGTRGHSEIAGLFVGSVVQRLLHFSNQPVLAVPGADE
jgi:nucleotide-binding universal stress UspA family protein